MRTVEQHTHEKADRHSGAKRDRTASRDISVWILLGIPVVFILLAMVLPLAQSLITSVQEHVRGTLTPGDWTAAHYQAYIFDNYYRGVLVRTVRISALSTIISALLGYPLAIFISQSTGRVRLYSIILVLAPLLTSVVVRTYGWMIILGPAGLMDSVGDAVAGTRIPQQYLYSEPAMVLGLVHVFLAFMVLSLVASLDKIDPSVISAGRTLGASRFQVFTRIIFPLTRYGLLTGCFLVFALSAGAFVTPTLLGGVRNRVLASVVQHEAMVSLNWPFAAATAFVILVIAGFSYYAMRYYLRESQVVTGAKS